MARVIAVASVKGGVGKTTTVSNLATVMQRLGYKVLAIDANITGATLGLHLGTSSRNILTIHDVLKGNIALKEAIYKHSLGFHVLLGGIYLNDLANVELSGFKEKIKEIRGDYDLILIDCAAGLNEEALSVINSSDELLLITTPDLPSVADVYKLIEYSENNWIPVSGVVVNKENNGKYKDITINDVEEILGKKVLEIIPKENEVEDSVNLKKPVVNIYPNSKSSKSFERLAYSLVGKEMPKEESMIEKILGLFRKQ
ncbi:MAG: cell division ATPase MinD [Candidatus Nanoarchaeia archaeon]|nr:cell division ATPase MinD [Candidatus Nanoarchaeia archaeon]MDD5053882.1 cell division ATPase MinD [Candidatus Nanoarchaeia archaeon]MDD5500022.1 cell division ATPase MinD [Candidatus Nanoarchaeia archaeon]